MILRELHKMIKEGKKERYGLGGHYWRPEVNAVLPKMSLEDRKLVKKYLKQINDYDKMQIELYDKGKRDYDPEMEKLIAKSSLLYTRIMDIASNYSKDIKDRESLVEGSDMLYDNNGCYIIKGRKGFEVYKPDGVAAKLVGSYGSSKDYSDKWFQKAKERCDKEAEQLKESEQLEESEIWSELEARHLNMVPKPLDDTGMFGIFLDNGKTRYSDVRYKSKKDAIDFIEGILTRTLKHYIKKLRKSN